MSFLRLGLSSFNAPGNGPFSVAELNLWMRKAHESGEDAICLVHVPSDDIHATLSTFQDTKRRRAGTEHQSPGWVCWQPYGDVGHFFSVKEERGGEVTVLDSHISREVQASASDFIMSWLDLVDQPIPLFAVRAMPAELPDMQNPAYHLRVV